jgi:methanogenic corrinoid protein MtbC1
MPPPPALAALQTSLVKVFGDDVLPRLKRPPAPAASLRGEGMARLAVQGQGAALADEVQCLLDQGTGAEDICQVYLTDAARLMGEWWASDRCGFVEVTLGVILLQDELHRLAPRLRRRSPEGFGRSALMLPAPGEQHGFGLSMVAEFFRASGWNVEESHAGDALSRLAEADFALVALTVGTPDRAMALPPFIARLRAASRYRRLVVMVGGAAINAEPSLLPLLGADATAPDAASALHRAEALVTLLAAHA